MKYKGVLFDFDGTLVNSMSVHYEGWSYAFGKFGKKIKPKDLYIQEGQGVKIVGEQLLKMSTLPLSCLSSVLKEKQIYFKNNNNIKMYPGSIDLI
ncbi:MAG: HAD family phosphatase, partial [Calditrichia bacterium]|nr:HAD family phosphatase [Calditrichia bacterium]